MSEKTNILYLCVLIALSDFELQKEETHKIIKISKELQIDFNVHDAIEEIQKKFRDDFDSAAEFYLNNIKTENNRHLAKKCLKEVALADNDLKDREVRFLVLCKKAWGREFFD
jgi:catalase